MNIQKIIFFSRLFFSNYNAAFYLACLTPFFHPVLHTLLEFKSPRLKVRLARYPVYLVLEIKTLVLVLELDMFIES